jgi:choline/glycine/proline betaine transport protein
LPFSVILLISIYGLLKALRRDLTKRESLSMATIAPTAARNPIPGREGYAISRICRSDLL